jgi:D-aminoacyl-tRNA deacylase
VRFAILSSNLDIASINIRNNLTASDFQPVSGSFTGNQIYELKNDSCVRLYTINSELVNFEQAEKDIEADFFIFVSRHQSKSGEKTLSVHVPGNYGKAEYGGQEGEFCICPAELIKTALITLNKIGKDCGFSITLEATHHGPLVRKPVMFIEIGSKEEQWRDEALGKIIAETAVTSIKDFKKNKYKVKDVAIGFGGIHYCSNFNKILLNTDTAMSHICPKYNIDLLNESLIKKMIKSTYEHVDFALLDWKGLTSSNKEKLIPLLRSINLKWNKIKN